MKKKLMKCMVGGVFLLGSLYANGTVQAAPVSSEKHVVEQADGKRFEIAIRGDEFHSYSITNEGEIIKEASDGYWYYETSESYKNNEVSAYRYGRDPRPSDALTEEEIGDIQQSDAVLSQKNAQLATRSKWSQDQNLLVILVEFEDASLSTTEQQWHQQIFGDTGKSVKDFYQEQTEGRINIVPANETSGENDGVVTIKLDQKHPNTGLGVSVTSSRQVMEDALKKADEFIDFSQYDTQDPSRNELTQDEIHVMAIYAGYESSWIINGQKGPSVQGHYFSFFNWTGSFDGKKIKHYTTFGEKMDFGGAEPQLSTIGVIAHEFGHDLNLPDLYNTAGSGAGLGYTSLMASGNWGAESGKLAGETPAGLDAYSKERLGLPVQVVDLDKDDTYTLRTILNDADSPNILRINTANPYEYFLIENRQMEGFDKGYQRSGFHSGGIAVYRVDTRYGKNVRVGEQLVTLLEAEQNIIGYSKMDKNERNYGDPFYYIGTGRHKQAQATSVTRVTDPSTKLSDGTFSDFIIEVLDESSSLMNVKISKYRPVEALAFDFSDKTIEAGQTLAAVPSFTPENATNQKLEWQSADTSIASVDEAGEIKGIKAGQTTITAISEDGQKEASFQLTVTRIPVAIEDIIVDKDVVYVGIQEEKQTPVSLQPKEGYLDELVWTIKDTNLASVSDTGKITGLKPGETTLTVATQDGKIVRQLSILVGDDHGNTVKEATKIKLDEQINAVLDYEKDIDCFEVNLDSKEVPALVVESPTGFTWAARDATNQITPRDVKHEGMFYSIIKNHRSVDRFIISHSRNGMFDGYKIGKYAFTVKALTTEQMKAPEVTGLPVMEVGQTIDLKEYTQVFNGYHSKAAYTVLSLDAKEAVSCTADGILTVNKPISRFNISVEDTFTGVKTEPWRVTINVKDAQ